VAQAEKKDVREEVLVAPTKLQAGPKAKAEVATGKTLRKKASELPPRKIGVSLDIESESEREEGEFLSLCVIASLL
jgi:hypothetical protein